MSSYVKMISMLPVLYVADMELALAFYVDMLGFEMSQVWLKCDKIEWCLIENGNAGSLIKKKNKNTQQFSSDQLFAENRIVVILYCDDIDRLYNLLLTKNIEVSPPAIDNHHWLLRLSDPDGHLIEFCAIQR